MARNYFKNREKSYLQAVLFLFILFAYVILPAMCSRVNRVVFKNFNPDAGDDPMRCYGNCLQKGKKFELGRCDGGTLRFNCPLGKQLNVILASSFEMPPDVDICLHTGRLNCFRDVLDVVKNRCDGARHCALNTDKETSLRNKCRRTKNLAIDIKYNCVVKINDIFTTPMLKTTMATIITPKLTSSKSIATQKSTQKTTSKLSKYDRPGVSHITLLPLTTTSSTKSSVIPIDVSDTDTDMFWLLTAYTILSDGEFLRQNKFQLATALLLAMFIGIFIYLCILLANRRRAKKKKDRLAEKAALYERIECTQSLPLQEVVICDDERYSSVCDVDRGLSVSSSFNNVLKGSSNHTLDDDAPLLYLNEMYSTPRYLPRNCSPSIVASRESYEADARIISNDNLGSDVVDLGYPKTKGDNSSDIRGDMEQYHASDEYSSSPQIIRPYPYHRTDRFLVRPKIKFATTMSNDGTSQDETKSYVIDGKRMRVMRKHNEHRGMISEPPRASVFVASNGKQYVLRQPRKRQAGGGPNKRYRGGAHVRNYNQKLVYSDNEASVRRKRCGMGYKYCQNYRQPGRSLCDLHSSMYDLSDNRHRHCSSSMSSRYHSSIDEQIGDDATPLQTSRKMKEFSIEESGYQSGYHTATDSICSSVFSTDQEDAPFYSPAPNLHHKRKVRSANAHGGKHGFYLVRNNNNNAYLYPAHAERIDFRSPDLREDHHEHVLYNSHPYTDSADTSMPYTGPIDPSIQCDVDNSQPVTGPIDNSQLHPGQLENLQSNATQIDNSQSPAVQIDNSQLQAVQVDNLQPLTGPEGNRIPNTSPSTDSRDEKEAIERIRTPCGPRWPILSDLFEDTIYDQNS